MPRATDPNGAGKGDDLRPVNPVKYERGWLRCAAYGYKCPLCNKDGLEKNIKSDCKLCRGIGYLDKKLWKICEDCKGAGVSSGIPDFEGTTEVCTMSFCQTCKGIGYVEE